MTEPTGAVFVSYASQDAEAAGRIAAALRVAGIEVWLDQSELRGGDAWDRRIREQVHDCRLFIAVISAQTERRDEGYFRREWRLAVERAGDMAEDKAFVIPVAIDGTSERSSRVPDPFRRVQWTRLPGGETPPAFVERVQRLLSPDGSPARASTTRAGSTTLPLSPISGGKSRRAKAGLWAIRAVLALALTYFMVDRFWLSKRTAATANSVAPSATAPGKSIAVLPFVDLSEKHDQQYFVDGLAEELIDLLTKVPNLVVAARTSSFHFKSKSAPISEIGQALNVAYVLEGSVREADTRLRITAQLIRTKDERHVWSTSYDTARADIFKVQDDIAGRVILALRIVLADVGGVRSTVTSWDAYRMYLEGQFANWAGSQAESDNAVASFRAALAIDPEFAPAWTSLADALAAQASAFRREPKRTYEEARAAAQRALKLDPNLVAAHLALEYIQTAYDWDFDGAEKVAIHAAQLEPGNAHALREMSHIAVIRGDWAKASEFARRALARDPLSPGAHETLGLALYCGGQFADSAAELRRSLDLDPSGGFTQASLGRSLMMQGRLDEALRVASEEPNDQFRLWSVAMIQHAMGREADVKKTISELKREYPTGDEWGLAWIYAVQGRLDDAFQLFDKAYERRDIALIYLKCIPEAPAFIKDARYRTLLRRVNLSE